MTGAAPRSRPDASRIALLAHRALLLELACFPKPGLVSLEDRGSHRDMDANSFRRSADAIQPFFQRLALAGADGAGMDTLRRIGCEAETAMLRATGGVNTHRGAIFGAGLLCAAAGARLSGAGGTLGDIVAARWGEAILAVPPSASSNGTRALAALGRPGGARLEAASGFPALWRVGLPALRQGLALAEGDSNAAGVQCLFALMACLTDTTLLHRGGAPGLLFAQRAARGFLRRGGVGDPHWRDRALRLHHRFRARSLSPGGSADLLAMTMLVDALDRDAPAVVDDAAVVVGRAA